MVEIEKLQHGENVENKENTKVEEFRSDFRVQADISTTTGSFSASAGFQRKIELLFVSLQNLTESQNNNAYTLNIPSSTVDGCITQSDRDSAVTTMRSMQRFYNFGSDTLAAAVYNLDRFISKVKIRKKYMSCVAAASFFLSSKMNEESEFYPSASDLAGLHRHSWKASDLKRMEKLILDKLDWNLYPAITSLAYLEKIYKILQLFNVSNSEINEEFFQSMVERSEICLNYTRCAKYSASTLALAISRQSLKEIGMSSSMNKFLLLNIQTVCQVSDQELFECQCAISHLLHMYDTQPATHPKCLPTPRIVPRPNLIKRPSIYGSPDLPTIEEVSSEIRDEPETPDSPCHVVEDLSIVPYYKFSAPKSCQSYCLLLDQCFCSGNALYMCKSKCNISIA
ncbi:cyclin-G1-like [Mya arenaria]|uniref:cyclin-G1-like n=1 Tax=Mya arenaria TaxID=6604 RepID=UPI0022E69A49|nr:cyclin-G1-like [Mya arenaria]